MAYIPGPPIPQVLMPFVSGSWSLLSELRVLGIRVGFRVKREKRVSEAVKKELGYIQERENIRKYVYFGINWSKSFN